MSVPWRAPHRAPSPLSCPYSLPLGSAEATVIVEPIAPDAHGLLILAPEVPLGSGWLGGDRVVGRAAIRDLLIKAARFTDDERQRLRINLPSRALTLRLEEIGRHFVTSLRPR